MAHSVSRSVVLALVMAVFFAPLAPAIVEWRNLNEENHLSGRKTSNDYLIGKVVLVDRWGARCPPCRALLPLLEIHWQTFKNRQFVLLGGHCEGWGTASSVKDLAREHQLTYPIYQEAGLLKNEPQFNGIPFLYVVDPTGKVIYRGRNDRLAVDHVVGALARWETPAKLQDWQTCIEFELQQLPAHAILRYAEFKKAFPEESEKYAAPVRALNQIAGMPELVKLVKIARNVRDYLPKSERERGKVRSRISETISKYRHLKESDDPQIVREAKNAIADLQWAQAEL